jgi:hypothetical protein
MNLITTALLTTQHAVATVAGRLHSRGDAYAVGAGWQVTGTRWGGRVYHHHGFDHGVVVNGQVVPIGTARNITEGRRAA